MHEFGAGPDQLLVVYLTADQDATKGRGFTEEFLQTISGDADRRARDGLRIVAYDSLETSGHGTSGGMVFNTGNEFPLDIAVTVVYARSR